MYERSRVKVEVEVEPRPTSRLSATPHILSLFYVRE